jgi:hypothetical protein
MRFDVDLCNAHSFINERGRDLKPLAIDDRFRQVAGKQWEWWESHKYIIIYFYFYLFKWPWTYPQGSHIHALKIIKYYFKCTLIIEKCLIYFTEYIFGALSSKVIDKSQGCFCILKIFLKFKIFLLFFFFKLIFFWYF